MLAGIPKADSDKEFEFYIVPSKKVAKNVKQSHQMWLSGKGQIKNTGRQRKDSNMRVINIPPAISNNGWSIEKYKNRWDIIESLLR